MDKRCKELFDTLNYTERPDIAYAILYRGLKDLFEDTLLLVHDTVYHSVPRDMVKSEISPAAVNLILQPDVDVQEVLETIANVDINSLDNIKSGTDPIPEPEYKDINSKKDLADPVDDWVYS